MPADSCSNKKNDINNRRPRDGPATTCFEADPLVRYCLLSSFATSSQQLRQQKSQQQKEHFGLVAVAGWPPNLETIQNPYETFLSSVQECFDKEDLVVTTVMEAEEGQEKNLSNAAISGTSGISPASVSDSSTDAAVYLYPVSRLHVTVATMRSVQAHEKIWDSRRTNQQQQELDEEEEKEKTMLEDYWKEIMIEASNCKNWPKAPLELEIDRAQIGTRAGILLWKETTGGLDRVRSCIREVVLSRRKEEEEEIVDTSAFSIPHIIHSTFLRFHRVPETSARQVQERFERLCDPNHLREKIFVSPISLTDVKLVCERTPYMHIPNDARHVLATFPFV